jgi:hypothetical protein
MAPSRATSAPFLKRKERYDRYAHRNEKLKMSSQQGRDDDIRLEGRPHRVIIISAKLSAQPSKRTSDGAMAQ